MRFVALIFILNLLCSSALRAETLNEWILSKLRADEQLWINAIDGHRLELLQSSKFYVPFFMELPAVDNPLTDRDATLFGDWKKSEDKSLLPGG